MRYRHSDMIEQKIHAIRLRRANEHRTTAIISLERALVEIVALQALNVVEPYDEPMGAIRDIIDRLRKEEL